MHALDRELLTLLEDGPATITALETATGQSTVEVWRALARLFAACRVEPRGTEWHARAVSIPQ